MVDVVTNPAPLKDAGNIIVQESQAPAVSPQAPVVVDNTAAANAVPVVNVHVDCGKNVATATMGDVAATTGDVAAVPIAAASTGAPVASSTTGDVAAVPIAAANGPETVVAAPAASTAGNVAAAPIAVASVPDTVIEAPAVVATGDAPVIVANTGETANVPVAIAAGNPETALVTAAAAPKPLLSRVAPATGSAVDMAANQQPATLAKTA